MRVGAIEMQKAIVTARIAPIYAQTNMHAPLTDEVLHGMVIDVLEDENQAYCYIRTHYGYEGFVHRRDLLINDVRAAEWVEAEKYVIYHAAVDVLDAPKVQAERIGLLTRGCAIIAQQDPFGESPEETEMDGWSSVCLANGQPGFVRTKHIGDLQPVPFEAVGQTTETEYAFRCAVTETALSYLGTQYRWGGKTPEGIDCSGLCSMAYMLNGVLICRDAHMDAVFPVRPIAQSDMQAGDLLYFPGHIAMSLGGERFIHSTAKGHGVCINSLNQEDADCREDLADNLLAVGGIF